MKRPVPALGLALAGLGLILAGAAIWVLFTDASAGFDSGASEFTAVPAEVSFKAPTLKLRDLDGSDRALEDYGGQVILVNLWATWCPPCRAEMPGFQRFYEANRDQGFTVIAVNDGEAATAVKSFVTEHGLTFPVWLDPTYEATDRAFKARNLPTSYVIDRAGMVRLMWIGAISETNLEKYVIPLIKE